MGSNRHRRLQRRVYAESCGGEKDSALAIAAHEKMNVHRVRVLLVARWLAMRKSRHRTESEVLSADFHRLTANGHGSTVGASRLSSTSARWSGRNNTESLHEAGRRAAVGRPYAAGLLVVAVVVDVASAFQCYLVRRKRATLRRLRLRLSLWRSLLRDLVYVREGVVD